MDVSGLIFLLWAAFTFASFTFTFSPKIVIYFVYMYYYDDILVIVKHIVNSISSSRWSFNIFIIAVNFIKRSFQIFKILFLEKYYYYFNII